MFFFLRLGTRAVSSLAAEDLVGFIRASLYSLQPYRLFLSPAAEGGSKYVRTYVRIYGRGTGPGQDGRTMNSFGFITA
jgi:hypothetical protein